MRLWIARDENGQLWLFDKQPVLRDKKVEDTNHSWFDMAEDGIYNYCLNCDMFPEVTFKNSPQEIKLRLVSGKISESIVNKFTNTLNFTYDKSEKCMVAKIYNADLTSLKNIIESKL